MEQKKLIEVALPLETINKESAREKSIRHGHPSTLHLWWSRKPTATARAVIWASLVDDPSSHPEQFPSEEEQNAERQRLFRILEQLVMWKNSNDKELLDAAKAEIMKSTDGNPPVLLDPFAGGGSIPLEAQRLGLEAHAHDLNPVAVMINKAMIEIPPKFADQPPVNPEGRRQIRNWHGAEGIAEDVRYYGEWMKQEAYKRIGHLYPKVKDENGEEHTVIAWIWTRTVKCPNPSCGCEMPLAGTFALSKRRGHEACVVPQFNYSQRVITYKVRTGKGDIPEAGKTSRGAKFKCIMCGEATTPEYIKNEAIKGRMNAHLMAVVAEGERGRIYISPDDVHRSMANVEKPTEYPRGEIGGDRRALWTPLYGLNNFEDLFTNRQLTALTTFGKLVGEVQAKIVEDGGSIEYGQAVGVYLAFVVDRLADRGSTICSWDATRDGIRNTFALQGIPISWNYAEGNPFSNSSGCFDNMLEWIYKCIQQFPAGKKGNSTQFDAQSDCGLREIMVSTDPPYYDNIGYADLSDFFYIWMRQSLKQTYPDLFRTMLVPKVEELVATPYRFDGSTEKARDFFEDGMMQTCKQIYKYARKDLPVTIYYAYKQSETDSDENKIASTGWETMLSAIIQAGFTITGTWPMRTEMVERATAMNTNALASSIVLVCRKRPADAPLCTRRDFINTLKRELKPALEKLQASNIAPVDLAQSAIGPGMGVYSRYSKVLEADGSAMSVRSALQLINQELDLYFNEQDGELDRESRFCVELYTQSAFNSIKFGAADVLARAKNTSVDKLKADGILYSEKGSVRLLARDEIPTNIDKTKGIWLLTQQLTYAMEQTGVEGAAKIVASLFSGEPERAKALAYRLFTIAERRNWASEAYAYNSLITAWPEVTERAAELASVWNTTEQQSFFNG